MPFSLLKLIIHENCAVKAKVAQTHCTGINMMKKAKKKRKHYIFLSNVYVFMLELHVTSIRI